jgi:hypothetical protein
MSQKYLYSTFFETKHWLESSTLECFALCKTLIIYSNTTIAFEEWN